MLTPAAQLNDTLPAISESFSPMKFYCANPLNTQTCFVIFESHIFIQYLCFFPSHTYFTLTRELPSYIASNAPFLFSFMWVILGLLNYLPAVLIWDIFSRGQETRFYFLNITVGCDNTEVTDYTNSLHTLAVLKNINRDLIQVPRIENAIDFALSYNILRYYLPTLQIQMVCVFRPICKANSLPLLFSCWITTMLPTNRSLNLEIVLKYVFPRNYCLKTWWFKRIFSSNCLASWKSLL